MADVTVSHLAGSIGTAEEKLLKQLHEAGLSQTSVADVVSETEKQTLLAHIKKTHGGSSGTPKKITLKRRTLSTLKLGGSANRGRTVSVEVRKKRTFVRKTADAANKLPVSGSAEFIDKTAPPSAVLEAVAAKASAKHPTAQEHQKTEEAARRRLLVAEMEAEADKRHKEAEARVSESKAKAQAEEQKKALDQAARAKQDTKQADSNVSSRKDKRDRHDLDEKDREKKRAEPAGRKRRSASGRKSRLGMGGRVRRKAKTSNAHQFKAPTEFSAKDVEIGASISVQQLSQKMSVKATEVIKNLMSLGVVANINQTIDQDTATLVVEEFGHRVKLLDANSIEKSLIGEEMALEGDVASRSPIVTVMGHVDHGKTSLLDYIRKAEVVSGEAGGITQHIGAYRVVTSHGNICFIDTPGHAAFSAMRGRGAQATDIIILVVAADDGVMPQTEEAIQHAQRAGVPIVVAVNKIDKEGADIDRVKTELAAREVIPEDWGGDTQFLPVSALTGEGIDALLEAVILQSEILELKAVVDGPAHGVVIESELDKGRGTVATLLIQNGTLHQGDVIVAGQQFGRVRAISNDHGGKVKTAAPSTPVVIQGLDGPPSAGDMFVVVKDEKRAREITDFRRHKADDERLATPATSLDNLLASFGARDINFLNIVVKADVKGSLEAIVTALDAAGNDEVQVNVVYSGVGGISEHDVNFAITANAVIFGFNVRADQVAKKLIEAENIDLRYYKVIYDLVDDAKAALSGMLPLKLREEIIGIANVRDVFQSKRLGSIAGCMIIEGTVYRHKKIRVLRDNTVIYEGDLESLRHYKEEVDSAKNGTECGIGVKNYNDVQVGDQIEVFETRELARQL